jgi:ribonuclease D
MRSAMSPISSKIFPMMLEKLRKTGRGDWLDQEMESSPIPKNYRNDPEDAWKRIKAPSRKPDVLGRLKALAAWREVEAQDKNIPRGRIVRDETLADLASHPPKPSGRSRPRCAGFPPGWKDNEIGSRLMQHAGQRAAAAPMRKCPSAHPRGAPLGKEGALVADLLKLLLKIRAARSTSPPGCWPAADDWKCWPRACARTCRSSKAGASNSSAATRSIWSRVASPSPFTRASC